ncbi:MAG: adenylate kinase [Deltaproteobacteria bacterium CG23_combo_of_CG06-09_8_20_14_all_51_20]|nr:adenylate kinase [bacterium]OIP40675.1 MAG: adenylate kinase [Desulfobacteraceae bacterium CG2_30_51_40]PIP47331.1 MAG: adenylate kinase [Deltaproteobacteria bacterium CG23_combo_of_CG06-09_8_20_14_all_51_20]PJB34827.1 MAG: adenylate kinase [Deltaproteobacteria bacterium CG_4_9_14_3_um_filter_51_14]
MKILLFGPNGSGKGTQGAIVKDKFNIPHIETGVIFRENISKGTKLGKEAKGYIDRGELVPDSITIPMILDRLKADDCKKGWLLDGFPRNLTQAQELDKALKKEKMPLDYVIEIVLPREIAKNRIMGRRLCVNDNNHPNNIFIDAIKPEGDKCRVCGGSLKTRGDDQDEKAIDQRHSIYYDTGKGTMAGSNYFKQLSKKAGGLPKVLEIDGRPGVKEVAADLTAKLKG